MRLVQLYPTPNNPGTALPSVDIVLVHGLGLLHDHENGGLGKTWTAEDGTVWPCDMLPKCMPGARVLCYEYNASIKSTTSVAGIWDHALALLWRLEEHRRRGIRDERPIIFVGHNLGGVIIKKALVLAHTRVMFKNLANATRGIVFFGTPHRLHGQDGGKLFAVRILYAVGNQQPRAGFLGSVREASQPVQPTPKLIEAVQANSEYLTSLTDDFQTCLESLDVSIVNFIESTITKGLNRVVVSREDSFLAGADNQYLSGDHVGMCRFCDNVSDWERFRPVYSALNRLAAKAVGNLDGPKAYHAALLKTLCTDDFHEYSASICPTRGTGQWIEQKTAFQAWRDRLASKLWICGKPAAGKTYLAKHIITQIRAKGEAQVLECFLDAGLKERNTCDAILRSTIHQLARKNFTLWSWAVNRPGVRKTSDPTANWTRQELMSLWPDIVARAVSDGNRLALIIDGFDEAPSEDQAKFLTCLETCEKKLRGGTRQNLSVLVLSRWCPSLVQWNRGFVQYEIHEQDNAKDIRFTVEKELGMFADQIQYSDQFQHAVCDAISRGAKGIYLWATVMIADIRIRMPGESQLQRQLENPPKSLAELFDEILGNIQSTHGNPEPLVRRVLLWVVFALEPLKLQELNTGLALTELWEGDQNLQLNTEILRDTMIRPEVFKASLNRLCGQLLRLSSEGYVRPIHRTFSQYLTTDPKTFERGMYRDWQVPNHHAFHLSEKAANQILGNMCAAYLMMPSFEHPGEPFTSTGKGCARWEIKVQTRIDEHPLVKYAALCWLKHMSLAGPVEDAEARKKERDSRNRATLWDMATGFGTSWFEVWWFFRKWRAFGFPTDGVDPRGLVVDAERTDNALVPPTEGQEREKTDTSNGRISRDELASLVNRADADTPRPSPPEPSQEPSTPRQATPQPIAAQPMLRERTSQEPTPLQPFAGRSAERARGHHEALGSQSPGSNPKTSDRKVVLPVAPIQVKITVDRDQDRKVFCHYDATAQCDVRWAQNIVGPDSTPLGSGIEASVFKQYRVHPPAKNEQPQYRAVKQMHQPPLKERDLREFLKKRKSSIDVFAYITTILNSDYLVKFYSWWEDDKTVYVAMEFVQHGPLTRYLDDALPVPEVLRISSQLFSGLEVLHKYKIIHRDLKPENILVAAQGPQWHIKLADFGISKLDLLSTIVNLSFAGSRGYMAPEIRDLPDNGESFIRTRKGNKVDIFSAGIIAYELFSGQPPTSATGDARRKAIRKFRWPSLPDNLKDDFAKLLAWDPEGRPSASDMAKKLTRWRTDADENEGVASTLPVPQERDQRPPLMAALWRKGNLRRLLRPGSPAASNSSPAPPIYLVAEQPESETEPNADAIRGAAAAIVRRLSSAGQKKELDELRPMPEERLHGSLEPASEDGLPVDVEWDGKHFGADNPQNSA